jgi:hypothetical protein
MHQGDAAFAKRAKLKYWSTCRGSYEEGNISIKPNSQTYKRNKMRGNDVETSSGQSNFVSAGGTVKVEVI